VGIPIMRWKSWIIAGLVLGVLAATSFGSSSKGEKAMTLELKSAAFTPGSDIPKKFTCDGPDVSPALSWSELPANTQSISLIMDDPDAPAGTWVHWVLYDLPATMRELPENVPKDRDLKNSARQGSNDFGRIGYGGPCPPPGRAHRYFFKLYALDAKTNLSPGATKAELERAMKGRILAQGELMGRYKR
jgi:Raf kinase inhibitor-like YbhB/YbcL family protein